MTTSCANAFEMLDGEMTLSCSLFREEKKNVARESIKYGTVI